MARDSVYQFVSTDTDEIVAQLIAAYEAITGVSVKPASPEKLFIQWVAAILVQERAYTNYIGNQNIPSRAEGENLDALAEIFFMQQRPAAKAAVTTVRFSISAAQAALVLIPAGTRVTDASQTLFWATVEDAYVAIGDTYTDVSVVCQAAGAVGNGYAAGQLSKIVDTYDYYSSCSNITVSEGGSDEADDDTFYELLRASMDGYSCAGARGGYVYWASQVSDEIGDVVANSPQPGYVDIYVLKNDGTPAGTELKAAVLAACSAEEIRPLTDYVSVKNPQAVSYDIEFTYYTASTTTKSATEIAAAVQEAVTEYVEWQRARFGRDINPDKLREFLSASGIKRIVLVSPSFTQLRDGSDDTTPQYALIDTIDITNGGYEDE